MKITVEIFHPLKHPGVEVAILHILKNILLNTLKIIKIKIQAIVYALTPFYLINIGQVQKAAWNYALIRKKIQIYNEQVKN